jgi:hypothetical protein
LNVAGAVASVVAVLGAYAVARQVAPQRSAVLVAAMVGGFPGFAVLSVTFMTDPTSFASQTLALACGLAALLSHRRPLVWYAAALAVAAASFTIRETAAVTFAAIAVVFCWTRRHDRRALATAVPIAAAFAVAAVVFYAWRQSLPRGQHIPLLAAGVSATSAGLVVRTAFTVCFSLAPALAVAAIAYRDHLRSRAALAAAGVTVVLLAFALHHTAGTPWNLFTGNYLTRLGATPQGVAVDGPALFPRLVWWLLLLVGCAASVVAAALATDALVRRAWRHVGAVSWLLLLVAAGQFALLAARSAGQGLVYDRYTWLVSLPLAAFVVSRCGGLLDRSRQALLAAGAAVILLTAAGLAVAVNDAAASAARWRAGELGTRLGYPADTVDAGFEWIGAHALAGPHGSPTGVRATLPLHWYLRDTFPYLRNCVVVSYPTLPYYGWLVPVGRLRYASLLPPGTRTLHVYRNPRACPTAG